MPAHIRKEASNEQIVILQRHLNHRVFNWSLNVKYCGHYCTANIQLEGLRMKWVCNHLLFRSISPNYGYRIW